MFAPIESFNRRAASTAVSSNPLITNGVSRVIDSCLEVGSM